jgi:hypothetical protein
MSIIEGFNKWAYYYIFVFTTLTVSIFLVASADFGELLQLRNNTKIKANNMFFINLFVQF